MLQTQTITVSFHLYCCVFICVYALFYATDIGQSGSTENLSATGSGLHRVPSLPRSYRQRSGIPVLTRDSSM